MTKFQSYVYVYTYTNTYMYIYYDFTFIPGVFSSIVLHQQRIQIIFRTVFPLRRVTSILHLWHKFLNKIWWDKNKLNNFTTWREFIDKDRICMNLCHKLKTDSIISSWIKPELNPDKVQKSLTGCEKVNPALWRKTYMYKMYSHLPVAPCWYQGTEVERVPALQSKSELQGKAQPETAWCLYCYLAQYWLHHCKQRTSLIYPQPPSITIWSIHYHHTLLYFNGFDVMD